MGTWRLLSIDSVDENGIAAVTVEVNLDVPPETETYVQQLVGIDSNDIDGTRAKLDAYVQDYQDQLIAVRAAEAAAAEAEVTEDTPVPVEVPDVPISELLGLE